MASEKPTTAGTEQAMKGQAQQEAKAGPEEQRQGASKQPSSGKISRREQYAPTLFGRGFLGATPFALMRRMLEDMDRIFGEYVPGRFAPPSERRELQPRGMPVEAIWEPQVDVVQREGKLIIRADLPGLSKDDVRVELTDEGLVLEGERRSELEEEREGMYRSERSYGSFCRVIPLPEGCDASGAEAHFENGVLEITLPLPEAATRARRIEIQEGRPSPKASAMH